MIVEFREEDLFFFFYTIVEITFKLLTTLFDYPILRKQFCEIMERNGKLFDEFGERERCRLWIVYNDV